MAIICVKFHSVERFYLRFSLLKAYGIKCGRGFRMLALFSAGIAPAFTLMAFFYLKDRFTEPLSLMVKTFLFGALLVFPIMFIQYGLSAENVSNSSFIQSFFLSGLLEEFFKWFIFIYIIFHHTDFD